MHLAKSALLPSQNDSCLSRKEPYISQKENVISWKEPYWSWKSPAYYEKSPTYLYQKALYTSFLCIKGSRYACSMMCIIENVSESPLYTPLYTPFIYTYAPIFATSVSETCVDTKRALYIRKEPFIYEKSPLHTPLFDICIGKMCRSP